jgi:transglutaminase-like putative cysteine protease
VNTPPFLLAAACALWAWQTGQWAVAAAVALALEAPRFVPLRWSVAQTHFNRLADFCSVLLVAVAAYLYLTFGNPRAILLLFQWLPVVLLPLVLAQAWGNQPAVGIAAFVWNMRKEPAATGAAINLGYPYLAAWLLAAAAANARSPVFYAGMVALAGWGLWQGRPARYAPAVWAALLVLAGGAGYGAQHGLARVQAWLEEAVPEWIAGSGSRTDPYRSRTDLGHIGELKLDDAIVLRVRPERGLSTPLLLHRASYNSYYGTTWAARNAPLAPRSPDATARWVLGRAVATPVRVTVFDYSPRGNPVLSLPYGTVEVLGLAAPEIRRNDLGTVQAEFPPGHVSYTALADGEAAIEAAPGADDLHVTRSEQALFVQTARKLDLPGMAAEHAVAKVRRYFADGFGYSTYQAGAARGGSALADFLTRTRAGHCEYFATATALLLRAAGVPARYATGFSVQEYSRIEDAYIVRERHAHAWVRAWVNGRWIDVDTTPAIWVTVEAQQASWWSPLADLWAWASFRVSRLAASARDEEDRTAFWTGIALALAAWLGWRLYRQRRLLVIGKRSGAAARDRGPATGADSEFFRIEQALARSGFPREPGETVTAWLARIESRLPAGMERSALAEIARLHYRYRFDPAGISRTERETLKAAAEEWLARNLPRPA